MNAVTRLNAHLSTITCPDELRELPAWLIWRFEHHEGEAKPRKVPYYTNGQRRHGVQGRAEDRNQLTTFDAARAAAARRGFDGVGFCPMPEFNIVALDFDRCVQAGEIHPQVLDVVSSTYAEYSPSGLGIRAFFRGNLGNLKDHGEPFGFETFSSKGFVTVTGNALEICQMLGNEGTVAEVDDNVLDIVRRRFNRADPFDSEPDATSTTRLGLERSQILEALDALPGDLDYDKWISVGMAIHHELGPSGFTVWDEWSKRSPKYTSERYGRERWKSFGKGNHRQVTARSLVRLAHEHGARISLNAPASPEEFDAIAAQAEESEPGATAEADGDAKPNRFQVMSADEFTSRPAPSWIVKGVIPRAELVVLFGESGSGKSFIALDIAAAIDRGMEWRGRRVKQGRVIYICAEGAGGFRNRMVAYQQTHGVSLGIGVIANAPNLLQKDDALDIARAIGKADVVIIDTFAQTTPGANENAAEDMGKALAHCKGIHRATGALVILVHHAGKDASKGARGWSGLKAAADAELCVERLPQGRVLRTSKMKDGVDDEAWGFDLDAQNIGVDEDGDVITSCVVREIDVPTGSVAAAKKMGPIETVVHAVVMEMAEFQSTGIELEAVIKEAVKRLPEPEERKRDTRRMRVRRSLLAMCEGDDAPFFEEDGCLSIV